MREEGSFGAYSGQNYCVISTVRVTTSLCFIPASILPLDHFLFPLLSCSLYPDSQSWRRVPGTNQHLQSHSNDVSTWSLLLPNHPSSSNLIPPASCRWWPQQTQAKRGQTTTSGVRWTLLPNQSHIEVKEGRKGEKGYSDSPTNLWSLPVVHNSETPRRAQGDGELREDNEDQYGRLEEGEESEEQSEGGARIIPATTDRDRD